jgi:hypothetical protein
VVCAYCAGAYLVEVDVHALELEVGGAIVAVTPSARAVSISSLLYVHAGAIKAVLAGDVLPERRANLIALLYSQSRVVLLRFEGDAYTLAGLEMNLCAEWWLAVGSCIVSTDAGHACLFSGGRVCGRQGLTISRMPGILTVLLLQELY